MKTFELYLTDTGKKNYYLSDVKKENFKLTEEQMQVFTEKVLNYGHLYFLTIFGEESTALNTSTLCLRNFVKDKKCIKIDIHTKDNNITEDFLLLLMKSKVHCSIEISDLSNIKVDKYKDILNTLVKVIDKSKILFYHTFDEDDIHLLSEFRKVCTDIGVEYDIKFSDSPQFWTSLAKKDNDTYKSIQQFYTEELEYMVKNYGISNIQIPKTLEQSLLSILTPEKNILEDGLSEVNKIFETTYIKEEEDSTSVFYNGKFLLGDSNNSEVHKVVLQEIIISSIKTLEESGNPVDAILIKVLCNRIHFEFNLDKLQNGLQLMIEPKTYGRR